MSVSAADLWLTYKKISFIPPLILEILDFQKSCSVSVKSIFGNNIRTSNLPGMELGMGS